MTVLQIITTSTQVGLTFGQILSLVVSVAIIVGAFWKMKNAFELKVVKIQTDVLLKITKVNEEIAQIKIDATTCRNTHALQDRVSEEHFKEWIDNNNKQHDAMFRRIDDVYKLMVENKKS